MAQANVLLNYYNFDGDWALPFRQKYLKNHPHVLILPLAYRPTQAWDEQSWQLVYGKGGEKYDNILRPFLNCGYAEEDIRWFDLYQQQSHAHAFDNIDMLFFTGGMPELATRRMRQLGIDEKVKQFDGIVAGASAGAMLQLEKYHITPDEDYADYGIWQGLGLVKGLDLEVHFLNTPLQNQCALRAHKEHGMPVYKMWHEGGLLVENGTVTIMGSVELLSD